METCMPPCAQSPSALNTHSLCGTPCVGNGTTHCGRGSSHRHAHQSISLRLLFPDDFKLEPVDN